MHEASAGDPDRAHGCVLQALLGARRSSFDSAAVGDSFVRQPWISDASLWQASVTPAARRTLVGTRKSLRAVPARCMMLCWGMVVRQAAHARRVAVAAGMAYNDCPPARLFIPAVRQMASQLFQAGRREVVALPAAREHGSTGEKAGRADLGRRMESIADETQAAADGNGRSFPSLYATGVRLRMGHNSLHRMARLGNWEVLADPAMVGVRWHRHWTSLVSGVMRTYGVVRVHARSHVHTPPPCEGCEPLPPVQMDEVEATMPKMAPRKAVGPDGLHIATLRVLGEFAWRRCTAQGLGQHLLLLLGIMSPIRPYVVYACCPACSLDFGTWLRALRWAQNNSVSCRAGIPSGVCPLPDEEPLIAADLSRLRCWQCRPPRWHHP